MAQSPTDTRLASLGLLLGAGMIAYSYYRSRHGIGPMTPPKPGDAPVTGGSPLAQLKAWADSLGLRVTSDLRTPQQQAALGGKPGSLHVLGRAIDVGVRGLSWSRVEEIIKDAKAKGWNAFFEPAGDTRYGHSTGPHVHVSISPPGSSAQ